MEKNTITHTFTNEIEFNNALEDLDHIIACHYNYEYNAGYIVVEQKEGDE